jgi:hypothetical protein
MSVDLQGRVRPEGLQGHAPLRVARARASRSLQHVPPSFLTHKRWLLLGSTAMMAPEGGVRVTMRTAVIASAVPDRSVPW